MKNYFIHDLGICETDKVGKNTRVWAYTHILKNAIIGDDCNICDFVFIENDVTIGDRVTIKSGVQLWDGVHIEDDVFIGPNVTFTNDKFPRSKKYPDQFLKTIIKKGSSIGANSTILPGITIGERSMVAAGSVVTKSVPDDVIVKGNPARFYKNLNTKNERKKIYEFKQFDDKRGSLTVGNFLKEIPFRPLRYFLVFNVPENELRGEHAHKECHQFLICVKGSISVVLDDGREKNEFILDSENKGVYIPPKTWGKQYNYSKDAVLLVFASHYYDEKDYIHVYEDFLDYVR